MEKKKILIIVLVIVIVLIAFLAVHIVKNMNIINEISEKQEIIARSTNYHCITQNSTGSKTEIYYKDGISKTVVETNNATVVTWSNENTKELINYFPKAMKATVGTGDSPRTAIETLDLPNSFMTALFTRISSDKINNEECYVVKSNRTTTYISKENGTILKRIGGTATIDGVKKDIIVDKKWEFNKLTDEDMTRPDLTGYDISE